MENTRPSRRSARTRAQLARRRKQRQITSCVAGLFTALLLFATAVMHVAAVAMVNHYANKPPEYTVTYVVRDDQITDKFETLAR